MIGLDKSGLKFREIQKLNFNLFKLNQDIFGYKV